MNLYEELKNIFKDSKFNVVNFQLYIEYQVKKLTINLYVSETLDSIELELNLDKVNTIEELNDRIKKLVNFM